MKNKYSILFIFALSLLICKTDYTNAQGGLVCKITFCNCCGDSLFYTIYNDTGGIAGSFWTQPILGGCSGVNVFNAVPGKTYSIVVDCHHTSFVGGYFTAC